jgi:hypothetical protein
VEAVTATDGGDSSSTCGWRASSHPRSGRASFAPPPTGSRRQTSSHRATRSCRGSRSLASTWRAESAMEVAVIARRSRVGARRRGGRESGSAAEEVGFRPINIPPGTYICRGSARIGRIKTFMDRAVNTVSNRRLFLRPVNFQE